MRRLSEVNEEANNLRRDEAREHQAKCDALLKSLEGKEIDPYRRPEWGPADSAAHDKNRKVLRAHLSKADGISPADIACDHCGTEMVYPEPNRQLASHPPKKRIGCPGCGFMTTRRIR
jgi:hypothetical protein